MRRARLFLSVLVLLSIGVAAFRRVDGMAVRVSEAQSTSKATQAFGRWNSQNSNTVATLHGLSVVNANVVWASGTGGTYVRTTDGGETWQAGTVVGAEKLDFRDVYAVDAQTAYLFSFGDGREGRIYKTTDEGKNWLLGIHRTESESIP